MTEKVKRPWGYYRVVHTIDKTVKVKELVIEPGKSLSMQRHFKRSEMWYVVKGKCMVNEDLLEPLFKKVLNHPEFSLSYFAREKKLSLIHISEPTRPY